MTPQLDLFGEESEPVAAKGLNGVQRQILRHIADHGSIRPVEAGTLVHGARFDGAGCTAIRMRRLGYVDEWKGAGCCQYASSDGWDALRRLEKRGLVRPGEKGWVRT